MAATLSDLKAMYDAGDTGEFSHMIVKCDMFDYEDYPVYVKVGEDARAVAARNSEKTMECYSYALGWDIQSVEHRAYHWE